MGTSYRDRRWGDLGSLGGAHHIVTVAQRNRGRQRKRPREAAEEASCAGLVWSESAEDQAVSVLTAALPLP